jgi:hypothetical protein
MVTWKMFPFTLTVAVAAPRIAFPVEALSADAAERTGVMPGDDCSRVGSLVSCGAAEQKGHL